MAAAPPTPPPAAPVASTNATPPPAKTGAATAPAAPITPPAPSGAVQPPAKPGSARARMHEALEKTAVDPNAPVRREAPTTTTPPPDATSTPDPNTPPPATDPKTGETTPPATTTTTPEGKKASPWKLFEAEKAARLKAETENQELRNRFTPEAIEQQKVAAARLEKAEARLKELEDEIRFVDYRKSEEFQEKYEKPYVSAWNRAMKDLAQIPVENGETGEVRALASSDLLRLVNLSLPEAKALAKQIAPDFVDDLMQHRTKIRELYDAQAQALDDAKKTGGEREKQRTEQTTKQRQQISQFIGETWKRSNETITSDETFGKYFKPVEGDTEGNERLEKGFKLADSAFTESPLNPNLTPEERSNIVRRHAVVRNRAAAFGRLVQQNQKLEAELAAAQKALEEFRVSVPPNGGAARGGTGNGTPPLTARQRLQAELEKSARPA